MLPTADDADLNLKLLSREKRENISGQLSRLSRVSREKIRVICG
jgi:hypothetical protein